MGFIAWDISASLRQLKDVNALKNTIAGLPKSATYKRIDAIVKAWITTKLVWTRRDPITPPPVFEEFKKALKLSDKDILFTEEGGHAILLSEKMRRLYNKRRLAQILA
jgi:hypothetical protein